LLLLVAGHGPANQSLNLAQSAGANQ